VDMGITIPFLKGLNVKFLLGYGVLLAATSRIKFRFHERRHSSYHMDSGVEFLQILPVDLWTLRTMSDLYRYQYGCGKRGKCAKNLYIFNIVFLCLIYWQESIVLYCLIDQPAMVSNEISVVFRID
jgi:hypothetical protein